MDRNMFIRTSAALGAVGALGSIRLSAGQAGSSVARAAPMPGAEPRAADDELIPVAFAMSDGATVIDFAGPWEVFQDVMLGDPDDHSTHRRGFRLFMVAADSGPIEASAGMRVLPHYTVANAPPARVVVVGAQSAPPQLVDWIRRSAETADVVMSVCTGAFILGRAGLLDGLEATTHHDFWDRFERTFPQVVLRRSLRYLDHGRIATAGGLTSGIDLALHVVERYYGRDLALRTATYMEYESRAWMDGGA